MNVPRSQCRSPSRNARAAFTLPELMVTSSVLLMLVGGLLSVHLLALRLDRIGRAKLAATDDARRSLGILEQEIRSAGWVQVGNGDAFSFAPVAPGQPQQGNAIQVYPDKAVTNRFIRYYVEPDTQLLLRLDSQEGVACTLARFVTNSVAFAAEDFAGNVQTNPYNNRVISLTLHFSQLL